MNNNKLVVSALALVLVAGLASPVFAQQLQNIQTETTEEPNRPLSDEENVIFDGGTADFFTAAELDLSPTTIWAEDFELTEANVLNDVHIDVSEFGDTAEIAQFEWFVYNDNAGSPGPLIASGIGINVHKMAIDQFDNFRYWFDLDNPVPLDADTRYWIGLRATTSESPSDIFWWTTSSGFGNGCNVTTDNGGFWQNVCGGDTFQLNLVLTGPHIVGGELLPIDNTALVLAGIQSSTVWMFPVLAVAAGAGAFYLKVRANKE